MPQQVIRPTPFICFVSHAHLCLEKCDEVWVTTIRQHNSQRLIPKLNFWRTDDGQHLQIGASHPHLYASVLLEIVAQAVLWGFSLFRVVFDALSRTPGQGRVVNGCGIVLWEELRIWNLSSDSSSAT